MLVPTPFRNKSPLRRYETEKFLAHVHFIPDRYPYPASIVTEVQILIVQMGLLSLNTTPAHDLEDFPSAQIIDEPQTGDGLFGHMWIHKDKVSEGFEHTSRPGHDMRVLTINWAVKKKRTPRKKPAELVASILLQMSRTSKSAPPEMEVGAVSIDMPTNCQSPKSTTTEYSPLELEVALFLKDMPEIIKNCESKKRRMPETAWLENKKRRIEASAGLSADKLYICRTCNKVFNSPQALGGHCSSHKKPRKDPQLRTFDMSDGSKKRITSRPHLCEICGKSYPTGYQLGGHKRAHYNKNPLDQK